MNNPKYLRAFDLISASTAYGNEAENAVKDTPETDTYAIVKSNLALVSAIQAAVMAIIASDEPSSIEIKLNEVDITNAEVLESIGRHYDSTRSQKARAAQMVAGGERA